MLLNLRNLSWEQAIKTFMVFKQWHIVFFLRGGKKSNRLQLIDTI